MPEYINSNVSGFLPSEELVSRNLHTDVASVSSQVSVFNIDNDVTADELGTETKENNNEEIKEHKSEAFNSKSGTVLGKVSDKAIENDNPIISCEDPNADCEPKVTNTPTPIETIPPTPTRPRKPTVTPFPEPMISVIPIPSKFPTLYPCPPIRLDEKDIEVYLPCPDISLE